MFSVLVRTVRLKESQRLIFDQNLDGAVGAINLEKVAVIDEFGGLTHTIDTRDAVYVGDDGAMLQRPPTSSC